MAPLVVPGVTRFAVHGTYSGRPIVNILDMLIDPNGGTGREDAILDQAKVIVSAWVDNILTPISSYYAAQSVSWVDMDSLEGSVGSVTDGTGSDFPANGGQGDAPMPGNVAMRVNKSIVGARGQRQGRMYLVGLLENVTGAATPNFISDAYVEAMNGNLANFLGDINQDGGLVLDVSYDSRLVVVHTHTDPLPAPQIPEYVGQSEVLTLTLGNKVATQRRRLG